MCLPIQDASAPHQGSVSGWEKIFANFQQCNVAVLGIYAFHIYLQPKYGLPPKYTIFMTLQNRLKYVFIRLWGKLIKFH